MGNACVNIVVTDTAVINRRGANNFMVPWFYSLVFASPSNLLSCETKESPCG